MMMMLFRSKAQQTWLSATSVVFNIELGLPELLLDVHKNSARYLVSVGKICVNAVIKLLAFC